MSMEISAFSCQDSGIITSSHNKMPELQYADDGTIQSEDPKNGTFFLTVWAKV